VVEERPVKLAMGQMLVEGGRQQDLQGGGARGKILAKGAYGVDAQQLIVVEVGLTRKTMTGTDIAPMLRGKGHNGP